MQAEFLCTLQPARPGMPDDPTPEERDAVGAHFAYYQQLRDRGVLVLAGRTTEPPYTGVFIFRAESEDHAHAIVQTDPAVARSVMTATLQPFRTALTGRGPDEAR